jgi:hypothetical protein
MAALLPHLLGGLSGFYHYEDGARGNAYILLGNSAKKKH